ncbi:MAG: serine hydrolase [Melioribacteraceae bacterium]|nr:serine hydrolase [Melioribacteraceae bacterium]
MKFHIKVNLILLFILSTIPAQSNNIDILLTKLDEYYQKTYDEWNVPGMSIAIVKDGKTIFSKGYGLKEVGKSDKVDENTLYAIASNSKAFTSAMIAILVQEDKLEWNDRVQDYIPYFEIYDPVVSQQVKIKDILSHRVGLGTFSGDVIWYKSILKVDEIIKRLKYLPKRFDFRDGYGYSNVMYLTAGEIIKTVTGKNWIENIQERFLNPLIMDRTIISPNQLEELGNFATPHGLEDGKNIPIEWVNWEEIAAMGGLISSVNDIAKWMIFNLNNGIIGEDTILEAKSRNLIWTPHNNFVVNHTKSNDFDMHFRGYGLGWELSDYHGNLKVSHGGGYDGMISSVTLIPDQKLGVVVLTNGMESPTSAITNFTLDAFLDIEETDWSTKDLERSERRKKRDTRIEDRINSRVLNTKPSLDLKKYTGIYHSDIYGNITVQLKDNQLNLDFEYSPDLKAALTHWHYDVWKISWVKEQAWFKFGTVKFNMDNNLKILGMDFDIPNNDIFFEELKP